MNRIECNKDWRGLNEVIQLWVNDLHDGTIATNLFNDAATALANGFFDNMNGPYVLLFDQRSRAIVSPNGRQLGPVLLNIREDVYVSREFVEGVTRASKRPLPSFVAQATERPTQPSPAPGTLRPAAVPMIIDQLRLEYGRAEAASEKPPNVKEVARAVELALRQKGCWASKRQIEKLAEAEEFKSRRWPPGKRR